MGMKRDRFHGIKMAAGQQDPPTSVTETFYLTDESGNTLTDESDNRLVWSK